MIDPKDATPGAPAKPPVETLILNGEPLVGPRKNHLLTPKKGGVFHLTGMRRVPLIHRERVLGWVEEPFLIIAFQPRRLFPIEAPEVACFGMN